MNKKILTWKDCREILAGTLDKLKFDGPVKIYGVPRGGVPVALMAREYFFAEKGMDCPIVENPAEADLIVDDIIDSGETYRNYCQKYPYSLFVTLIVQDLENPCWYVFPWEQDEVTGPEENIRRILQFIGEDVKREGLLETPKRVLRSYEKLYGGYNQNPKDLMKTFVEGACDEMVVLKDISFYSTCEHHMLPFYGKAHIAYIPNGKVIGVSKLARLLEIFSRRLQIQERIGQQVVDTLMQELEAKGAMCVIEGQHFCMTSRGVEKETAKMVTSAVRGVFRDNLSTRNEFLALVKG